MNLSNLALSLSYLSSPIMVTILVALAILFIWISVAPAPKQNSRIIKYGNNNPLDQIDAEKLDKPFLQRAVWPLVRRAVRLLGALAPKRSLESAHEMIQAAGGLNGLRPLDFFGIRMLAMALLVAGAVWLYASSNTSLLILLRNAGIAGVVGFFLPLLWLQSKVSKRKQEMLRALPDALDMLTIGVEAGLAFESALLRVGEKWQNPLTLEFRRTVAEMRMGVPRALALKHMADRSGVREIATFVAVLVQSDALGVSISEVLHGQAAQMRVWRRQRVQELAQQASTKMVFPLVFLVLPSMFIVILGPSVPLILNTVFQLGK
jgi:tight adherence protein C